MAESSQGNEYSELAENRQFMSFKILMIGIVIAGLATGVSHSYPEASEIMLAFWGLLSALMLLWNLLKRDISGIAVSVIEIVIATVLWFSLIAPLTQ